MGKAKLCVRWWRCWWEKQLIITCTEKTGKLCSNPVHVACRPRKVDSWLSTAEVQIDKYHWIIIDVSRRCCNRFVGEAYTKDLRSRSLPFLRRPRSISVHTRSDRENRFTVKSIFIDFKIVWRILFFSHDFYFMSLFCTASLHSMLGFYIRDVCWINRVILHNLRRWSKQKLEKTNYKQSDAVFFHR